MTSPTHFCSLFRCVKHPFLCRKSCIIYPVTRGSWIRFFTWRSWWEVWMFCLWNHWSGLTVQHTVKSLYCNIVALQRLASTSGPGFDELKITMKLNGNFRRPLFSIMATASFQNLVSRSWTFGKSWAYAHVSRCWPNSAPNSTFYISL